MADSAIPLFAVMGETGAGKSAFINSVIGEHVAPVGHELESCTTKVEQYLYTLPDGRKIGLVDVPGFNDYTSTGGAKSSLEILRMIAGYLNPNPEDGQEGRTFSGIAYLHTITGTRIGKMGRRDMKIFKELCGKESMKNVVVVTTFWDQLSDSNPGVEHEANLMKEEGLLQELKQGGAKFVRWGHYNDHTPFPSDPAFQTPRQVINHLLSLEPVLSQFQTELAAGKTVEQTSAGLVSRQEFEDLKHDYRQSITAVQTDIKALRTSILTPLDLENAQKTFQEEIKSATEDTRTRLADALKAQIETTLVGERHRTISTLAEWKEEQQLVTSSQLGTLNSNLETVKTRIEELMKEHEAFRQSQTIIEMVSARTDKERIALELEAFRSKYQNLDDSHRILQEERDALRVNHRTLKDEMEKLRQAFEQQNNKIQALQLQNAVVEVVPKTPKVPSLLSASLSGLGLAFVPLVLFPLARRSLAGFGS
ncbi:hypothetical protein FA15DRAFT_664403 [Coprinopsis marcescibilis]|uniref:AIG1-type G domain-containing protein n=1 Tax=Coprinopsis marcescibilis TaxID=230819 RepID=A0A5C3L7T7_COPMA|nr:hypothetical protein FA15DRAFT_664403 [Coprinopsis marcescibilis]